jgi:hypothetical protein
MAKQEILHKSLDVVATTPLRAFRNDSTLISGGGYDSTTSTIVPPGQGTEASPGKMRTAG